MSIPNQVAARPNRAAKPYGTAVITGASLGIGLALARLAAPDHRRLVVVARSAAALNELKTALAGETAVDVIAMDWAAGGAAERLMAELARLGALDDVDTLINNAGIGLYGRFLELDAEADARMLQLKMIFLTALTRGIAAGMVRRGRGRILNVASTAAFQPGPLMATYYASKAFVLSFSEALGNELKDHGVTVTALCPGPTKSGFQDKAAMHGSRILTMGLMTPEAVAAVGYRALAKRKAVVVAGAKNAFLVQTLRFTPRAVVTKLSRYISERGT